MIAIKPKFKQILKIYQSLEKNMLIVDAFYHIC